MTAAALEGPVEALLCDADGCLFPSEEPAFDASAVVTNDFLTELGSPRRFSAEELRLATTGKNFRTTAAALAAEEGSGVDPDELERWVELERREVTAHLWRALRPDPLVFEPLSRLASGYALAVVSSSAMPRVEACLRATDLDAFFAPENRFSAESSLRLPASKPDPAIYVYALEHLGLVPGAALAIEDSVPGAQAAIGAGCRTLGNVMFVPAAERAEQTAALEASGVVAVIASWQELEQLLASADAAGAGASR